VTADKSALAGMTDAQIAAARRLRRAASRKAMCFPFRTPRSSRSRFSHCPGDQEALFEKSGTAPSEAMPTIHATTLRAWHSSVRAEHSF